jgi:hypothetical protein
LQQIYPEGPFEQLNTSSLQLVTLVHHILASTAAALHCSSTALQQQQQQQQHCTAAGLTPMTH